MTTTVAKAPSLCSKPGGRPIGSGVDPAILHLEGHVEELAALSDDAEAFVRCRHAIGHAREAMLRYKMAIDLATTLEQAQLHSENFGRLGRALSELSHELALRASRLVDRVIPEVQRCYAHAEAVYARANA